MDGSATARNARLLIGGKWVDGSDAFTVTDKFSGAALGRGQRASPEQVDAAVASAKASFDAVKLDAQQRYKILMKAAELIEARRDVLAATIVAEAGFPYVDAENEVTRAAQTFIVSAEEGKRLTGEVVPIEAAPGHAHRMAFTIRQPRGVVCGITAFNSPLNMVAHKVAPALASGNTIVVKPPEFAPFSATLLTEIVLEAGLPPGHLNLVHGPGREIGPLLFANPDIAFYSFTGSTPVGKILRAAVGLRPAALELGSIAATLVCADADLDRAATRCAQSAFRRAGQACTSTQRLFVDRAVLDDFSERLVAATRALKVGDPHDRATIIGPLISERDAVRALAWVDEARAAGARVLTGGTREGALMQPTILTDVTPSMRVICDEIFAPVMSIVPFDDLDWAVAQINSTSFGLAAGIFTRDIMRAFDLARRIRVGVAHINEPSSSRVDLMPFSGVNDSGMGSEGPRYAMREMTEERLITISLNDWNDSMTNERMTGAMFIAHCLKQEGVDKVFGQCGHTNYALIDACDRLGIEYVSFRHEQQAVHAADAYYRVSHRLAVINVHLSPGLTNALTGVATAAADGTPMVVISGNTPAYHNAREAHQQIRLHADASQGDMFRPICKRVWRVDDAKFLVDVMPRAINLATSGRSGAVLIDVPMDVFSGVVDAPPPMIERRPNYARPVGAADGIAAAAAMLMSAARPVVFAGNGVTLSDAADELAVLARLLGAPVATTLMGKGLFPETDPLSVGTTGIWGARSANDTTRDADVILAIGTAFGEADCSSWRPEYTFAIPGSKLIQIDIDPTEIGKSYPVDVGIVGDAKATIQALIEQLRKASPRRQSAVDDQAAHTMQRKRDWANELVATQHDAGTPIHPARLLREVSDAAPDDAIFVTDVGWNKNGAGQQLQVKRPRSFITSGGMATMGFSPAAAIGAKLGAPERKVIGLVGDGGLMSVLGALATSVELNIPVLWVLFNNFCFSTIRIVGSTYFDNTYGTEFEKPDGEAYNPDFMLVAKAFGIESRLVSDPAELKSALDDAMSRDHPFLLEVRTRGDLPMPRTGYWDIADFLEGGNVVGD